MRSPTRLCLPIVTPAASQLEEASRYADLLELRLDLWESYSIPQVASMMRELSLPVILTLRGGTAAHYRQLLELEPDFCDIDLAFLPDLCSYRIGKTKIIGSYHASQGESCAIERVHRQLLNHPVDLCKIATWPATSQEALQMVDWMGPGRIGVCMGEYGPLSRILAPTRLSEWTYACLDEGRASAVGQIPASELIERYRFREVRPETAIYALVGDPVCHSPGPRINNLIFRQLGLDALFVAVRMPTAAMLPFQGVAVTMPLKGRMAQVVESVGPEVRASGALNTIALGVGHNTDGLGALDAIEHHQLVAGCRVAVVGAGGTGRAVAYEAARRGAEVALFNRTLKGGCCPLEELGSYPYDILVHATPLGMGEDRQMAILAEWVRPGSLLLEAVHTPRETELMRAAQARGCTTIPGIEMYRWQLYHQYRLWFGERVAEEAMDVYLAHCA